MLLGLLHLLRLLHIHLDPAERRALMRSTFADLFSLPRLDEARALGAAAPPKCKLHETRTCALSLVAELSEFGGGEGGGGGGGGAGADAAAPLGMSAPGAGAASEGAGEGAERGAGLLALVLELHEQAASAEPRPDAKTGLASGAPRVLWEYEPAALERARCGYVGLRNLP